MSVLAPPKLWIPQRALVTATALAHAHGRAIAERLAGLGIDVVELPGNRLTGLRGEDERETYRRAKGTLAVVVAPPSARKLQPIPPSADWQFHLARGCPAHCQYCYLAGSLPGPPVTRAYANLEEILGGLPAYEEPGRVTSFEASCYTDPLGIEHLTGSLARTVEWFAGRPGAHLRFTTKFDGVDELATLDHGGRTRPRVSVNASWVAKRFEGGTAPLPARIVALGRLARAGYPVGLVVAPLMPFAGWEKGYGALLDDVRDELAGIDGLDLTVELITHRFSDTSKQVLRSWYPGSSLEMDEASRAQKRTPFGARKWVYPREDMRALHGWFGAALTERLPGARLLYFT